VLSTEILLQGYRAGIFPMAINKAGDIAWFSPDPRALIPLDERFHISRTLQRRLKQGKFEVTFDRDFPAVICGCSKRHGETWISPEIIESYCGLHMAGHAHSVEAWHAGRLAGGLYGVHIGGVFFGESMFYRVTDASKIALVTLVERLRTRKFALLDTQWMTPHLERFGTFLVPKEEYLRQLKHALKVDREF
jgi:leucyl/phenylalanyl-tRNA--protein transferase